jgi:hypothetical protein
VAQTAGGKLWVLDSRTGSRLHELTTTHQPWPQPPLFLGSGRVGLVTDPRTVVLLDLAAGKEVARPRVASPTTLSGRAPLVAGAGDILLLIVDRNFGPTLQRLDPQTGKALWAEERLLGTDPVAAGAVAFDRDAIYSVSGGVLSARRLEDGRACWRTPLPAEGRDWRLLRTRSYLLVYPQAAGARELDCDSLLGSLTLAAAFPLHPRRTIGLPVLFLDPNTGGLVQRLNFPSAGPAVAVRGPFRGPEPLLPRFRLMAPPVRLQVSRHGVVATSPGIVAGRTSTND